jgi:hypothetical protein
MDATVVKLSLKDNVQGGVCETPDALNRCTGKMRRFYSQEVASLCGQLVPFVPAVEAWDEGRKEAFYFNSKDCLIGQEDAWYAHLFLIAPYSRSLQNPIKNIIARPT